MKFAERLQGIGLERERVAVALLALSFLTSLPNLLKSFSLNSMILVEAMPASGTVSGHNWWMLGLSRMDGISSKIRGPWKLLK